MKPPRSDKSFIDRLEVHIDTIVNFFISIISLFETILKSQYPITRKNSNSFPPPPMSHLKNFSALILVNLYTPPPKILQPPPPETFQTIEKKSQPLDTNSTTQRKCYPSVEYPPPPKKKNKPPNHSKKTELAISRKKMSSPFE